MVNNNTLVPGFNDEKDDSLKITLSKIEDVPNCVSIILNGYVDTYNSSFSKRKSTKLLKPASLT